MMSKLPMVGVLILTHGRMAEELLSAARTITGSMESFEALALDWEDDFATAQAKVEPALERLDRGAGVLILTDIYGGTPSNVAMGFVEPGRVEMLSGVNLPMVVRLGCLRAADMSLGDLTDWIRRKGRDAICVGSSSPRVTVTAATIDPCD
ncbi:MAG: PTS sugar transporter subunit IIA [Acidobacteriota bacterium]